MTNAVITVGLPKDISEYEGSEWRWKEFVKEIAVEWGERIEKGVFNDEAELTN